MIVIDSSALIAIIYGEPERAPFNTIINRSDIKLLSAPNLVETSMVVENRYGDTGKHDLNYYIQRSGIEITAIDYAQAELAREAFRRYGRGRHPANLNFGDCFAYALAKSTGYRLLYKGNDFAQTDLAA